MSIGTYSDVIIIAKQQEIEKLYKKLDSLPENKTSIGPVKSFRDNSEYSQKTDPLNNGFFRMSDVITGEVNQIDSTLKDYQFLYIKSAGNSCAWKPELFLSANDIDYVLMVENASSENEPYEESVTMRNRLTNHYEHVSLVSDDPMISDDPRYGEKPSEFILYGKRLVDKASKIYEQMNDVS